MGRLCFLITCLINCNYQWLRDGVAEQQWDDLQNTLDYLGAVPVSGEPLDAINAGISVVRGDYVAAGLGLGAMIPGGGVIFTGIKQSHHIIPKAVYKEFAGDLAGVMKRDGKANLIDLPVPFHGNHPQYNKYVTNLLEQMKSDIGITPGSIENLQGHLRGKIDEALQSGQKLNDYFRPLVNE
ncbi:hypothetical protein GR160_07770 [Flavobacterium sp. Sd200]|uniref:AHH domain-containing protein n=1 Tax=Flavobacterium sp. Sd200 TaxID=2692211 RepID=UPI00137130AF|nr:AHH domain-containing protein [Flavobacterium sp. Sd200]MXN91126.1 hypothetical protein [Flavobacterium sp. Sd200]